MPDACSTSRDPSDTADWLAQAATGFAVIDRRFCFVYANPAFVELTHATGWRGAPLTIVGDAEPALAAVVERTREVRVPVVSRSIDVMLGGAMQRVDITASVLPDERVLLELHVLGAKFEDGAAPRVSESLRGLAHEMKNPLAGVRGAAQLLKRRMDDPEQRVLADLVIAEVDRLSGLADRLLHPRGKITLRAVNLHEIAERARALIDAQAGAEVKLERDYDPSLPDLRGDADSLLQVALNLMRNALQAGARTITVRTRVEHGAVIGGRTLKRAQRLDVTDNGCGVPEELRESLFLPLVSGRADGAGLGLALAQEIALEHGGQISFRSRRGHTTFSLTLPAEPPHG